MKKKVLSLVMLFCLLLSLNGCGSENSPSGGTPLVLNEVAHSVFYAPQYVAIEEGYFADEGIDLTLTTGFGADKTMTALLSGEADIGFMGSESSIYVYLGNTDDYIVNFAQLTQRAGNFLVSREKLDSFSFDMLQGKEILGGRKGGMPQMVFEYILKKNGISPSSLNINQSIDFGSTAAAFTGGQGDFTIEFEPSATLIEQEGKGYVVASLGVESGYVPYTAYSAKKSFLAENPDTVLAFTKALQQGMDYVNSHSAEEIAKVISPQFPDTDMDTLTATISRYQEQNTWKDNLIFEEESFILLQNILEEAGELEQRIPYEDIVNTDFATKAAGNAAQPTTSEPTVTP